MIWEFGHWEENAPRRLRPHRNDGIEFVIMHRGRSRWMVDGRYEDVPPGSLFFTMPWQLHGSERAVEPGCRISWMVLPLSGGRRNWRPEPALQLGVSAAELQQLRRCFATMQHCHPASALLRQLLPATVDLLKGGGRSDEPLLLRGLLTALLAEAAAVLAGRRLPEPAASNPALDRVRAWIAQCRQVPQDLRPLDRIAADCGLRRTRFAELVAQETGDSPLQFRNRQRIEQACLLLSHGHRRITDIALDCGFSSSQYFARVFKQFTGMTPQQWREQHGAG